MNKGLLKYVLLGVVACICISAKQAEDQEELAMVRCSKNGGNNNCSQEGRGSCCPENERKAYYEEAKASRYYPEEYEMNGNVRTNRRHAKHDQKYSDRYASKCEKRCGTRSCFPDNQGNKGYTFDSAGRRRCLPSASPEYRLKKQTNCDNRGKCQEYTKLEEISPVQKEVTFKRKSAAQKVREGY